MTTTEPEVDGRVLRGRRNREAIVDALLQLYSDGHLRPTAAVVAEAAGLSTRSVYHHFDDMKSLILEVSARSEDRWKAVTAPPSRELPIDARLEAFAKHRATRWSIAADVIRAGLVAEQSSKTVARIMQDGRRSDRVQVADLFDDAISTAGHPEWVLAALDVAFDFATWNHLHRWSGVDDETIEKIVVALAGAAFA